MFDIFAGNVFSSPLSIIMLYVYLFVIPALFFGTIVVIIVKIYRAKKLGDKVRLKRLSLTLLILLGIPIAIMIYGMIATWWYERGRQDVIQNETETDLETEKGELSNTDPIPDDPDRPPLTLE